MAFEAFIPKITIPSGTSDTRRGDGIVMQCAGQTMIVDAFEGGEATDGIRTWLKGKGTNAIDIAVLTHPHWDHYNGMLKLLDAGIKIKLLLCYDPLTLEHGCDGSENGKSVREDMDNAYKVVRRIQAAGGIVRWVGIGRTIKLGDISWKVWRKQPTEFTEYDDGHAWAFVNDGSLILYSPEIQLLLGGDGPCELKEALAYFDSPISGYDIAHHGNNCSRSNAEALKKYGCVLAWESCVERDGAGTTDWTAYGARRVKQQGIPVWMQDEDIYISAGGGKITFRQGSKTVTKKVSYQGEKVTAGWIHNARGWWYRYDNGGWAVGWAKLKWSKGTDWFYFDEDGYMQTGWVKVNGYWYYLDPTTGAMQTGWLPYKGHKCYLEPVSGKNQGHAYCNEIATIDGKTYLFDKDCYATEVKGSGPAKGTIVLDISEHNSENIDWAKIKAAGYVVILRIGLRGSISSIPKYYGKIRQDYHFEKYLKAVKEYGIPYAIYFFPTAINDTEALEEADWIISKVKEYNIQFVLPVFLDSEMVDHGDGRADGLSRADRTRYLKKTCDALWAAGIPCGIYASTSWFYGKLDMSQFDSRTLANTWCAQYASKCEYTGPYAMWQYTSKTTVDGIPTAEGKGIDTSVIVGQFDMTGTTASTPVEQTQAQDPVDAMIEIMKGEVGYHEKASAADLDSKTGNSGSNNYTKYGKELHALQPSNMDYPAAWCDCWFDWCVLRLCERYGYGPEVAREVLCGDFDDYTYASAALYKKAGKWTQTPARGYQIFFGGSGHTGGVYKVEGGKVYTIEGNKSDQVKYCEYSIGNSNIIGYGIPKYELLTGGTYTAADPDTEEEYDMPLIKQGSKGKAVKILQIILGGLAVDGSFGPLTLAAVKKFQKANSLDVDGEVGPLTWRALLATL